MNSQPDNRDGQSFSQATTVQQAASRLGFDWPDIGGVLDKVEEEVAELRDAVQRDDAIHAQSELGDLLFAATSVARFLDADPAACLDAATRRFQSRMEIVKKNAADAGISLQSCSADRLDALWEQAKRLMRQQLENDLDK